MHKLRNISPKWLSTLVLFILWFFRGVVDEWIFGDIVTQIKDTGWGVKLWDYLSQYSNWIVGGIILVGIILSIIWASIDTKNRILNKIAWKAYDNLCEAFRELAYTKPEKERANIYARIEKGRGRLPDKKLDEMINLFLDAEAERAKLGMNPFSDDAQYFLSLNNERMRNHINNKYGNRRDGNNNKV